MDRENLSYTSRWFSKRSITARQWTGISTSTWFKAFAVGNRSCSETEQLLGPNNRQNNRELKESAQCARQAPNKFTTTGVRMTPLMLFQQVLALLTRDTDTNLQTTLLFGGITCCKVQCWCYKIYIRSFLRPKSQRKGGSFKNHLG